MKKGIHPEFFETVAHCACGASFDTRSTKPEIKVTLCSACHPFFTGQRKYVDKAGRIEKFQARYKKAEEAKSKTKSAGEDKQAKKSKNKIKK